LASAKTFALRSTSARFHRLPADDLPPDRREKYEQCSHNSKVLVKKLR
jgi:hypothetical protein